MPTRGLATVVTSALLALAPLLAGGAAAIAVTTLGPEHDGDPALWSPPLGPVCADSALAAAMGYPVWLGTGPGDGP